MNGYFFSTKFWKIGLSDDQAYFGRLVLKTIENRQSLPELTKEEQLDFFELIAKLESFYKTTFNATMFNYSCLMNNAYRDDKIPHVHFHFRPRYKNPIMVLGQEFTDPNFGMHYLVVSENDKVIISEEIRQHIVNGLKNFL